MNNTDKLSPEKKSYRIHFFALSILLGMSFIWSIYDEAITRRPWKEYQQEFFKFEIDKLKKELGEGVKTFTSPEIKKLEDRLNKLREEFKNRGKTSEYQDALKELDKKELKLFEASQELQFAKSLAEEAYYQYQHAFDTGGDYRVKKREWERLHARAKAWEPEVNKAIKERNETKKMIESDKQEITDLEDKMAIYRGDIARIEDKIKILSQKPTEIRQVVIYDFERNHFDEPILKVDRCLSCHMASDRKGFENFPEPFKTHTHFEIFIEKHPVEKFGCTSCHDGQGTGLSFYDAGHTPRNNQLGEKWKKEYGWKAIGYWEKPMLHGDVIQSSCKRCHPLEEDIPEAPVLSEGINLFRETLGCVNCHLVKGYEDVNKIGPDLSKVGSKVASSWLFHWVKDPKWHHQKSRMPNFKLSDQEALSITSFLTSLRGDENWKLYQLEEGILGNSALIAKGQELVRDIGCNGCHTIGAIEVYKNKTRDIAPILTNIGNKTTPAWILNWILEPTKYLPKALMPNLRLSLKEAEAIVAYLYSLKAPDFEEIKGLEERIADKGETNKGLKVIGDYGCYGCHDIPGTESLSRVGAELSYFGEKDLEELAFGYAKEVERSWYGFTQAKLKTPRIFETEVVVQKMPDFGLSDEETHTLTVLLKSFRNAKIPQEFTKEISAYYTDIQKGRKLIKKYNCIGCHEVEKGWGRENILVPLSSKHADEIEVRSFTPPQLMGEGAKVQSEWLFQFIHEPSSIRPWLSIKMPTFNFTDEQVNSIVRYFQSISGEDVFYHYWRQRDYTPEEKTEEKALFDILQCLKCHQFGKQGEAVSVAELAPDLSLTKKRLKHKWVKDWLTNPQSLEPGTRMPNFFFDIDEDGEVMELLPDPGEKIELLLHYLFSME